MLPKRISTVEELKEIIKSKMSEKRFLHSMGVAKATSMVLSHYGLKEEEFNGFKAGTFCGLIHDLGREFSDKDILDYCEENYIELSLEQAKSPVLAHGLVSASIAENLFGSYPVSWKNAIEIHTTGEENMDNIALALFIADYIEEGRTFLDDKKRQYYLSKKTIYSCAYAILVDMINHWKEKGFFEPSTASIRMLNFLKKEI